LVSPASSPPGKAAPPSAGSSFAPQRERFLGTATASVGGATAAPFEDSTITPVDPPRSLPQPPTSDLIVPSSLASGTVDLGAPCADFFQKLRKLRQTCESWTATSTQGCSSTSGNRGLAFLAGARHRRRQQEGEKHKGNAILFGDRRRDWRGSRRHLSRRVCACDGSERGCGGKEARDGLLRRYTARLSRLGCRARACSYIVCSCGTISIYCTLTARLSVRSSSMPALYAMVACSQKTFVSHFSSNRTQKIPSAPAHALIDALFSSGTGRARAALHGVLDAVC